MLKIRPLRATFLLAIMPMMLIVSGCGSATTTVGVSYTPPFAPVTFTINSNGTISIQGNLSIETPVGTFSVEANVSNSLQAEDNALLLIIRHKQSGSVVDDVYKIQTGQDEVIVVTNGTTTTDITLHKIFIDASKGNIQSIEVKDANSESTATGSSPIPAPTPIPTPSPTPEPRLYRADWSKGMDGWMTSDDDWHTVNGLLVNDGIRYSTILAPYPPNDIADYSVQADIRLDRYSDAQAEDIFGIIVRSPDGSGGYQLGVCASAGLSLVNCGGSNDPDYEIILSDGSSSPVKETPFRPHAVWHTYRIDVQGNTITAWIDGGMVFQVTDDKYLSAGRVGLWSDGCQISIRSFTITAL